MDKLKEDITTIIMYFSFKQVKIKKENVRVNFHLWYYKRAQISFKLGR